MEVADIIKSAAWYLGVLDRVEEYLDENEEDGEEIARDLLRAFNNMEKHLSLEYLPLYQKEGFDADIGEVYFDELSYPIVRIVNVYNEQGEKQPFTLQPYYLQTAPGVITVEYTYTPYEKDFYDETEHKLNVAQPLYVFGVLMEYYLARGDFEQAAVWEKRYKDAISVSYQMQKGKRMPSRGWW